MGVEVSGDGSVMRIIGASLDSFRFGLLPKKTARGETRGPSLPSAKIRDSTAVKGPRVEFVLPVAYSVGLREGGAKPIFSAFGA